MAGLNPLDIKVKSDRFPVPCGQGDMAHVEGQRGGGHPITGGARTPRYPAFNSRLESVLENTRTVKSVRVQGQAGVEKETG